MGGKMLHALNGLRRRNQSTTDGTIPRKRQNKQREAEMGDYDEMQSDSLWKGIEPVTEKRQEVDISSMQKSLVHRAMQQARKNTMKLPDLKQRRLLEIFQIKRQDGADDDSYNVEDSEHMDPVEPNALVPHREQKKRGIKTRQLSRVAFDDPYYVAPTHPLGLLCIGDNLALMRLHSYINLEMFLTNMQQQLPDRPEIILSELKVASNNTSIDATDQGTDSGLPSLDDYDDDQNVAGTDPDPLRQRNAPKLGVEDFIELYNRPPMCVARTLPNIMRTLERNNNVTLHKVHLQAPTDANDTNWVENTLRTRYNWSDYPWHTACAVMDFVLGDQNAFLVRLVYGVLCPKRDGDTASDHHRHLYKLSTNRKDLNDLMASEYSEYNLRLSAQTNAIEGAGSSNADNVSSTSFGRDTFKKSCGVDNHLWQKLLVTYATHYIITIESYEERIRGSRVYIE